ncbi:MAG TPA: hypothetical protein DDZ80_04685 [Cyanobacteria bacterium UBA8803]|nr:hypothetical protein [Cyanobacteria bacterium UBA9273]HBL57855.1 hypothetical protein [Cyanobacteria bacterium UBA8803]
MRWQEFNCAIALLFSIRQLEKTSDAPTRFEELLDSASWLRLPSAQKPCQDGTQANQICLEILNLVKKNKFKIHNIFNYQLN